MKRLLILILLGLAGSGFAEENQSDTFEFSSDRTEVVLAKGKEHTILKGNAKILSGQTEIFADKIDLYGKDFQFALCEGNITVKNKKDGILLKTDQLFFDRKEEISRISGWAEMEDQKNELIVKGAFLQNFQKEEITIIQIGVRILKEDLACRSEYARYNRKDEILELSGMPIVYFKGDEYQAAKITMNLDTDEILMEGQVTGKVINEKNEDPLPEKSDPDLPRPPEQPETRANQETKPQSEETSANE